ncbi:MAG: efflux transporter periplasmic adaptor subunit [Gammaproteobacteria bacterium RIFOXYD12_FULL_61_37]|nr:MAG: efflux transporter periplasmic adaptor subunit [Gammaproteobacteria bacterium RIFOXYD12_FULL_61_37]
MNRANTVLLIAALSAALASGYWFGSRHAPDDAGAGPAVAEPGPGQGRKLLYYRNPMGLPDTSPTPKKDSMGMDYIPVYEGDEPDDTGVVKVSPSRVQTLGVRTARVEKRVLDATVRAVGRVETDERRVHEIAPRFEGWIEQLHVNATGDPVRKGQPLFSVYSPELVSVLQELRIAEQLGREGANADAAARAGAERLIQAARERIKNWDVSILAEEGDRSRLSFTSPVDGIVLEKKAVAGMRFMPGETIFRIADLSSIWVIADIYEQDLVRVKQAQEARVVIDAFPGKTFDAKVTYLYPTLNTSTRTTPVRLEIQNPDGLLRPGMFAHVELASAGAVPRLTVPKSAVIDSGARQVVLIALAEGKYKPQPVKLGMRGSEEVEVLEGLAEGDPIVVSANFLIDAESNLKAALSGFSDAGKEKAWPSYEAEGSFVALDAAAGTLTLSHNPIPALKWPAMTMDFTLAAPELAKGIAPGQAIRFRFEDRGNGQFAITQIEPFGGAQDKPAANGHGGH